MTLQGVLVVDAIAIVLAVWALDLVRTGRLYVGYAVMFVGVFALIVITVSVPSLLLAVTALAGAVFPVSALTLIALTFMAFLNVYAFSQLTILSNRVASVVQELAIRQASPEDRGGSPPGPPRPDGAG